MAGWSSENALLAGSSRRRKSEDLLNVLPDRHGAKDVKEDEGTLGEVVACEISMGQSLNPRNGLEWQTRHNFAVENAVEHREEGCESETGKEPKI